ncbi:MAG TPA: glutamate 5-kinase [Rhabdochlamydiaceae bacterium]|jgi:glutamate 5-kinase
MKKIIIKVGTSTLTQGTQKLSLNTMLGLVQQIAHLRNQGIQLVLVSSGAVATGKELLAFKEQDSISKQTFASIGQVRLMQAWAELFSLFDLQIGQVLLTKEDFSETKRKFMHDTMTSLVECGIIPIVNENHSVATQEVRIGNNDTLAVLVGSVVEADAIILLTDQEGLYTANPSANPDAELVSVVEHIDERIFAMAGGTSSSLGTGGMTAKIQAAQLAARVGMRTIIASSFRPNVLIDLAAGKQIGTLFKEVG